MTIAVVAALAAALTVWALVEALRDRPVSGTQVPGMAVVEAGLLVQVLWAGLATARGTVPAATDAALLWGYLVVELLLLPAAFTWAFVERTRWSSVVMAGAGIVLVVLQARVWQIWQ